jgi:hypothetical protein
MTISQDQRVPLEPLDADSSSSAQATLLVGLLEGELALVRAQTGAVVWHTATHHRTILQA